MSQPLYHHSQLRSPRDISPQGIAAKFRELNRIIGDLQKQLADARGLTGSPTVQRQRLDMSGQRLSNVGRSRFDTDTPNVAELRQEALYARNGIHQTDRLILARGGIRTVTPAVAQNDLITKGQVERLIGEATGVVVGQGEPLIDGDGDTITTFSGGVAFPQYSLTLSDGENHDVYVSAYVFVRISGPAADFSVTGLGQPADGRMIILMNATPYVMTLADEHSGSTASWRIATMIGSNVRMSGPGVVTMLYDTAASRWIIS